MGVCVGEDNSVQELESLDPQKRELLEARFSGRVSTTVAQFHCQHIAYIFMFAARMLSHSRTPI